MKELYTALVGALNELDNPPFDRINTFLKSEYATLASVRNSITPIIAKHGLGVVQLLSTDNGSVMCETRVIHTSGQSISTVFSMPLQPSATAQQYGVVSTYLRRYSLMAMFNIVGEPDEDGEEPPTKPQKVEAKSIQELRDALSTQVRRVGAGAANTEMRHLFEKYGIKEMSELRSFDNAEGLTEMLSFASAMKGKSK